MNQKNKNILKKNSNDWAIFSIINNTKINEKPVVGWKIVAGKKITVDVTFHIIRKFRNEIVVKAIGASENKRLGELAAGAENLNFYLPDDMVLFQAEVKQIELSGDLRVKIPDMIAQVDRRKNMRLFVESGMQTELSFKKQNHGHKAATHNFKKNCFDISSGGASFLISKLETKFFAIEDKIDEVSLKINEKEFKMDAEVVNILEVEPDARNGLHYKNYKICLNYMNLDTEAKRYIDKYVFDYIDFDEAI